MERKEREKNPAPMPELCQLTFRMVTGDAVEMKQEIHYQRQFMHANQELMLAMAIALKISPADVARAFRDRSRLKQFEEAVIKEMTTQDKHQAHVMDVVKKSSGK